MCVYRWVCVCVQMHVHACDCMFLWSLDKCLEVKATPSSHHPLGY